MLPSEELLNKYRAAEKNSGTTEPSAETASAPETKKESEQPATVADDQGQGTTQTQSSESIEGGEKHFVSPKENRDDWSRHQKDWEKRLKRQERSFQAKLAEKDKQIAEIMAKLPKEPELKPEDFQNRKDWDDYNQRRMAEGIEASILEKQRAQKEAEENDRKEREEADKKLNSVFKTPERVAQFRATLNDFYEDEKDYLESEEGQLFQEFCDQSPVGLFMVEQIAKRDDVVTQMKGWSKDMLFQQLRAFENGLMAQIKTAQDAAKAAPVSKAKEEKKPVPTMPSTGPIGGSTPASGTFNAKEWLRKNRPEYYK